MAYLRRYFVPYQPVRSRPRNQCFRVLKRPATWVTAPWRPVRKIREVPEPDGEAVIGVPERDVDAELVHDP